MKQTTLTIDSKTTTTGAMGSDRLRLAGDTSAITAPGQFVNLKLAGLLPPPAHLRVRLGLRES